MAKAELNVDCLTRASHNKQSSEWPAFEWNGDGARAGLKVVKTMAASMIMSEPEPVTCR